MTNRSESPKCEEGQPASPKSSSVPSRTAIQELAEAAGILLLSVKPGKANIRQEADSEPV